MFGTRHFALVLAASAMFAAPAFADHDRIKTAAPSLETSAKSAAPAIPWLEPPEKPAPGAQSEKWGPWQVSPGYVLPGETETERRGRLSRPAQPADALPESAAAPAIDHPAPVADEPKPPTAPPESPAAGAPLLDYRSPARHEAKPRATPPRKSPAASAPGFIYDAPGWHSLKPRAAVPPEVPAASATDSIYDAPIWPEPEVPAANATNSIYDAPIWPEPEMPAASATNTIYDAPMWPEPKPRRTAPPEIPAASAPLFDDAAPSPRGPDSVRDIPMDAPDVAAPTFYDDHPAGSERDTGPSFVPSPVPGPTPEFRAPGPEQGNAAPTPGLPDDALLPPVDPVPALRPSAPPEMPRTAVPAPEADDRTVPGPLSLPTPEPGPAPMPEELAVPRLPDATDPVSYDNAPKEPAPAARPGMPSAPPGKVAPHEAAAPEKPVAALRMDFPGQGPEAKGLSIAREMDRRDLGFGDSASNLRMILQDRGGQTSTRELRLQTLEVPDSKEGDKTLIIFERPGDIEGTALLSYTHIREADDQWLYLPALKRVKRISSANKSGPFVGSEFAYEDMLSQEVEKYTFRWLRDESCGEAECFVVERKPVYENSGYVRQVVWIDKSEFRAIKIEYFDRKGDLLKTLRYKGYRKYLGRYWRAHELFMKNHQTGKATTLAFTDYRFRVGLNERDMKPSRLNRLR